MRAWCAGAVVLASGCLAYEPHGARSDAAPSRVGDLSMLDVDASTVLDAATALDASNALDASVNSVELLHTDNPQGTGYAVYSSADVGAYAVIWATTMDAGNPSISVGGTCDHPGNLSGNGFAAGFCCTKITANTNYVFTGSNAQKTVFVAAMTFTGAESCNLANPIADTSGSLDLSGVAGQALVAMISDNDLSNSNWDAQGDLSVHSKSSGVVGYETTVTKPATTETLLLNGTPSSIITATAILSPPP